MAAHMAARRPQQKAPAAVPELPTMLPQLLPPPAAAAAAPIRPPPGLEALTPRPPPGLSLLRDNACFGPMAAFAAAPGLLETPPAVRKGALTPPMESFGRFTSEETVATKLPEDDYVSSNDSIYSEEAVSFEAASEPQSPRDDYTKPWLLADVPPPPSPYFAAAGYAPGRILQQETQAANCVDQKPTMVLQLADCVSQTPVGTPDCPSLGSAGHHTGLCKPCDFFHRNSCRTGAACKFCHLCGPDENKRRKKQKHTIVRAMKRFELEVSAAQTHLQSALQEQRHHQQNRRQRLGAAAGAPAAGVSTAAAIRGA